MKTICSNTCSNNYVAANFSVLNPDIFLEGNAYILDYIYIISKN